MVPDPITVAHDVNQTMFDTLTPNPVEAEKYDLGLVPQDDWTATKPEWADQLTAIFRAVRAKYPVLPPRPTQRDVAATVTLPLSTTHQLIVGRIFSPSLRHALNRRILGSTTKGPIRVATEQERPIEGGTDAQPARIADEILVADLWFPNG